MNKRVLGIFVMTLLIASAVLPAAGMMKINNIEKNHSESMVSDAFERTFDPSLNSKTDILDFPIYASDSDETTSTTQDDNVYHIWAGFSWELHIIARWVPPQQRPICLWAAGELPPGAVLSPPCNCGVGSVTSTFYWTPDIDQAGTYYVTFYAGETCGTPLGELTVTIVVHFEFPEPSETYDIPAGEEFTLPISVRWDPPQPEKPICIGAISETLPPGSTFTPDCGEGQAEGTFWWTPTEEQICIPYDIVLIIGESLYHPIGVIVIRVHAIEPEPECDKGPKITDSSGKTTFHGVFVGLNHDDLDGPENDANAMYETLKGKNGWDTSRMQKKTGNAATKSAIKEMIDNLKDKDDTIPPKNPEPGDEILFYFADHGGWKTRQDGVQDGGEAAADTKDEKGTNDKHDEHLQVADGTISDDELTEWMSGFPKCVTITVKLDCCHAGGFTDGTKDLPHAKNANGDEYGGKIAVEPACKEDETTSESVYKFNDKNKDGVATPDELGEKLSWHYDDKDKDGKWDPKTETQWWTDKTGKRYEVADKGKTIAGMGAFTKKNLEGLAKKTVLSYDDGTNADRNNDGITTTKELYEYSIEGLYNEYYGDNDGDGLIDEDGYEVNEENGVITHLGIDNDGDGLIDEDPAPPSSAFWPNERPDQPNTPTGPTSGNTGQIYTYETSTTELDGDDLFYWFEWGDGTNTGWIGPYNSGDIVSVQHTWNTKGNYNIKVKARDRCYAESDWSDPLIVSMPKNKVISTPFLQFLENHPHLFPLLQQLLGLQ